jgi:hypothetical protein
MLPSSDAIEALTFRAKAAEKALGRYATSQTFPPTLKTEVSEIAREWLRVSPAIRGVGICAPAQIASLDSSMQDIITKAAGASRASALRKPLKDFLNIAPKEVVVPLIQHAGSPRQVLARQISGAFTALAAEETAYVDEAARCVTVEAYRAAIIMLWAAGVSRIHSAIETKGFAAFNAALALTQSKKAHPYSIVRGDLTLKSTPDLQRIADGVILVIGMDLFGYDLQVFQELNRLLGQRNDSAHPGMVMPKALDVEQFASKLNQYVFQLL